MAVPERVALYEQIEQEFLEQICAEGVVLADRGATDAARAPLIERLAAKGATVRNGGASVVVGRLSGACVACTGGPGSKTFGLTLRCNRTCYFCFNPNQHEFGTSAADLLDWRSELDEIAAAGRTMTHLAVTGGEPLLFADECVAFFEEAHARFPQAHLRLYTAGDFATDEVLERLAAAGLQEIRFSIKLDDAQDGTLAGVGAGEAAGAMAGEAADAAGAMAGEAADAAVDAAGAAAAGADAATDAAAMGASATTDAAAAPQPGDELLGADALRTLDTIARARAYIPDVMVEMPVIPGTRAAMQELLRRLDALGIFGINLLEFGFPLNNWPAFASRGFVVRNPPFPVLYDYIYAGGLPIEGSDLLALELVEFAIDEGLELGVHYCSLENKHRDQVHEANHDYAASSPFLELDGEDFFLKGIVLFGGDVAKAAPALDAMGIAYERDDTDGSIRFHPRNADLLRVMDVEPYVSYNIVVSRDGETYYRELKLAPYRA